MNKILVFLFLTIAATAHSQNTESCKDVKNGIFYYYPNNSANRSIIYRTDEFQKETNLTTGDTVVWKITWLNECSYSLQFQSSNMKNSKEVIKFLNKHKIVTAITKISEDYYTFKTALDNVSNPQIIVDTIWLKEKVNIGNNELFNQITNEKEVNQLKDTSKYAIVYLYRPGKITNSLTNYLIYFDDILTCVAKNNTGYIFKVLKEGTFQITSKLLKDESSVKLDVSFGKTYYVKSMIHWSARWLYNFKLEMATVTPDIGQTEFESIKHK